MFIEVVLKIFVTLIALFCFMQIMEKGGMINK